MNEKNLCDLSPLESRSTRTRAGLGLSKKIAAGALALALSVAGGSMVAFAESTTVTTESQAVSTEGQSLAQTVASNAVSSVGSVYALVATSGSVGLSSGSCVVIDTTGDILTNYHVIEGYDQAGYDGGVIQVVLNNVTYDATVVGCDPTSDIAVLHIDAEDGALSALEFGDSDALTVGSWVMTVGCPYGEDVSVSQGIVSGVSRSDAIKLENGQAYYVGSIQSDAMMNSGSSGGAMVNADGQLVGMTTYSATASGDWAGMSYAIPSNYISKIVNQILEKGSAEHPLLGVQVSNINDYYAYYSMVNTSNVKTTSLLGAQVQVVTPGSGAEDAGIQVGDVITALDGATIYSAEDLIIQVRYHNIGDTVTLSVNRDGEALDVEVVLGSDATATSTTRASSDGVTSIVDYIFGGPAMGDNGSTGNGGNGGGNGGGFGFGFGFGSHGSSQSGPVAQPGTAA